MTALVVFIKELENELNRAADVIEEEAKPLADAIDPSEHLVGILAVEQARAIRLVSGAISRAAKKALCL